MFGAILKKMEGHLVVEDLEENLTIVHDLWKDLCIYSPRIITPRKVMKAFSIQGDNLGDSSGLDGGRMTKTVRFAPIAIMKVLRWSFNHIVHTCVQLHNYQLFEQLFIESQIHINFPEREEPREVVD